MRLTRRRVGGLGMSIKVSSLTLSDAEGLVNILLILSVIKQAP